MQPPELSAKTKAICSSLTEINDIEIHIALLLGSFREDSSEAMQNRITDLIKYLESARDDYLIQTHNYMIEMG